MNLTRRLPVVRTRTSRRAAVAALALMAIATTSLAATAAPAVVRVVTALHEVQTGSVDGLGYLVISIDAEPVGPPGCQGRVLRIDAADDAAPTRLASMEQVALAAMLSADAVLVTVPIDVRACRDGKPTFTRLELLPASP